jgi:hypothetical protein
MCKGVQRVDGNHIDRLETSAYLWVAHSHKKGVAVYVGGRKIVATFQYLSNCKHCKGKRFAAAAAWTKLSPRGLVSFLLRLPQRNV